jgi:hypothetical protein
MSNLVPDLPSTSLSDVVPEKGKEKARYSFSPSPEPPSASYTTTSTFSTNAHLIASSSALPTVDPRPNPRYTSQMPPIFTLAAARAQEQEEKRRNLDAKRLLDAKSAQHHVVVYSWYKVHAILLVTWYVLTLSFIQDRVEPTVFEFQGGFQWPYFVLTNEVLSEVDLLPPGVEESTVRVQAYNMALRTWTKVKPGHIVTAKEGEPILVKAINVTECFDFDRHLASTKAGAFHIRSNLPQERAAVRQKIKSRCKVPAPPPSVISLTSSDEDDVASSQVTCSKPFRAPTSAAAGPSRTVVKAESAETSFDNESTPKKRKQASPGPSPTTQHLHPPRRPRRHSRSPSHAPSSSPPVSPAPGQTDDDAIDVDDPVWPADFYVVDIVHGFNQCDRARQARQSVSGAFTATFGIPFRRTTYYENRKRWKEASQTVRDKSTAAGRTTQGTWAKFISHNKAHKSQHHATAIRRVKRAARAITPEESMSD